MKMKKVILLVLIASICMLQVWAADITILAGTNFTPAKSNVTYTAPVDFTCSAITIDNMCLNITGGTFVGSYCFTSGSPYVYNFTVTFTDCSPGDIPILNISLYSEQSPTTTTTGDIEITVSYNDVGQSIVKNYTYTGTGNHSYEICQDGGLDISQTVDATIKYFDTGYYEKFHYLINQNLNSSYKLKLYMLNDTIGTEILSLVLDEANNELEGAIIRSMRYYPEDGTYKLVEMGRTNWEGQTRLHLIKHSEFYKFLIYYPAASLKKDTTPAQIYADGDQINFQIRLDKEIATDFHNTLGVDHDIKFNNNTNNFRYTFSDNKGVLRKACLRVYRVSPIENTQIATTCMEETSGTILIPITPQNGTTYIGKAYLDFGDGDYFIDAKTYEFKNNAPETDLGLFVIFLVTVAFTFIAIWSLPIAAIMVPIPILFGAIMGIIPIESQYGIILEIIAIIIAIIIHQNR